MQRAIILTTIFACAATAACRGQETIEHVVAADASETDEAELIRLAFDPNTIETVSGRVRSVEALQHIGRSHTGVRVLLHTPEETYYAYLAPVRYLERHDLALGEGDEIQISGSVLDGDGRRVIIATRIVKNESAVDLRDELGRPAWLRMGAGR